MTRPPSNNREAWLDALRGIAALAVVFDHLTQVTLRSVRPSVYQWVEPGRYGVFLFFLISGYIVPASLEQKNSVRAFWLSRLFRLYPMYLVTVALVVLLWALGQGSVRGAARDPLNAVLAQSLMMSDALDGPNLPNVVWSLTYEMAFYLLLTALFCAAVHRRSDWCAIAFGAGAVALGGLLPRQYLSGHVAGPSVVSAIADLLIVAGLAGAVTLRGRYRLAAACVAAVTALMLVLLNSHPGDPPFPETFEIPAILSLMFTGTVVYRAVRGEYTWLRAGLAAGCALGLCGAAALLHTRTHGMSLDATRYLERRWLIGFGAACLTFAAGLALRHRRVPRALAWLGLTSYSVYLLHPMVRDALSGRMTGVPVWAQALILVLAVVALVGVASVTYLLVERPAQRLGRQLARNLAQRLGDGVQRQADAGADHRAVDADELEVAAEKQL